MHLNGECDYGGSPGVMISWSIDEELRQLLRHVRLAGRGRPADDQPLLLQQQRRVPLYNRLRR